MAEAFVTGTINAVFGMAHCVKPPADEGAKVHFFRSRQALRYE